VKLVIFDVDGTLTPRRGSGTAPFERALLAGVRERCRELRAAGYVLAIASNQGGIAKGLATAAVEDHFLWLYELLDIAAYRFAVDAGRKKPSPAMLQELMEQFGAPAGETYLVGDAESDRLAAEAAGIAFVHIQDFIAGPFPEGSTGARTGIK
jgi:HAD superfamily hydrolase (TIGR01662 family)